MTDTNDALTALLPAVHAWFDMEHEVTRLRCDRATKKEGKALAETLLLPRDARPEGAQWLVTGMYVPLSVPLAAREQVKEALRKRTVHRVSLHAHPDLGQLLYAYADELLYYPNRIHRRLTLAVTDAGLRLVQSAEACGGCRGTGVAGGHKPKGGPYPTGPECERCGGAGFEHHYGVVLADVGPAKAIARLVPPTSWPTQAFYESDL